MAKKKSNPGMTDLAGHTGDSLTQVEKMPPLEPAGHTGSAPTPAEAEVVAQEDPPPKPKAPEPVKTSVTLKVWASLSGKKPDQLAGFLHYAQREGMRACPVLEWRERFEAFRNRPTK